MVWNVLRWLSIVLSLHNVVVMSLPCPGIRSFCQNLNLGACLLTYLSFLVMPMGFCFTNTFLSRAYEGRPPIGWVHAWFMRERKRNVIQKSMFHGFQRLVFPKLVVISEVPKLLCMRSACKEVREAQRRRGHWWPMHTNYPARQWTRAPQAISLWS